MVLVALNTSFSDCYVQRVFIQMGLLKAIKYSTFVVSALNGIADEWIARMNISGTNSGSFLFTERIQTI